MMKNLLILFLMLQSPAAYCKSLVFRIVDEKGKANQEPRFELPVKEQVVWEKSGWKCDAFSLGSKWGSFSCRKGPDLEISTRFECERDQSFKTSRSFRIAEGKTTNVVFSLWCE